MGFPVRLLARALRPAAGLEQAEAMEAMYWLRHLLALAAGIACGVAGALGLLTFLGFVLASAVGGSLWLKFQDLDSEDFPESQPIASEGLAPSIFLFVLCWVISYSLSHA